MSHSQRAEDIRADIVFEWLARDFLDDVTRDCVARVRVRSERAWPPPHMLRFRKPLQSGEQRYVRLVGEVEELGMWEIVEVRSMLEQVGDSHRVRRFPPVHNRDFRGDVGDFGVQRELSLLL